GGPAAGRDRRAAHGAGRTCLARGRPAHRTDTTADPAPPPAGAGPGGVGRVASPGQPGTRLEAIARGIAPSYSTSASWSGTSNAPSKASVAPPVVPNRSQGTPASVARAARSSSRPRRAVTTTRDGDSENSAT